MLEPPMLRRSTEASSKRAEQPRLRCRYLPIPTARSMLLQRNLAASCAMQQCVITERRHYDMDQFDKSECLETEIASTCMGAACPAWKKPGD